MGRNTLNDIVELRRSDATKPEPGWDLPGMERFSPADIAFFKRELADDEGAIVSSIHSLGWAFWPIKNSGYFDATLLRKIADFLEIQNKPFWDEYDRYCAEQQPMEIDDDDLHFG